MYHHFAKPGAFGLKGVPDPNGEVFEGRVFQSGDIVQVTMIELLDDLLGCLADLGMIIEPAQLRVDFAFHRDLDAKTMAMDASTFVPRRHVGKHMGGFE